MKLFKFMVYGLINLPTYEDLSIRVHSHFRLITFLDQKINYYTHFIYHKYSYILKLQIVEF